ncbi:MAG: hypothetical protein MI919_01620, partial [Holophagales bacterium]|nr:hypothetical protein [Holophagales bacterium]
MESRGPWRAARALRSVAFLANTTKYRPANVPCGASRGAPAANIRQFSAGRQELSVGEKISRGSCRGWRRRRPAP